MSRRRLKNGRNAGGSRYVAMYHWLMDSAAWKDLSTVARCAYLELASRYAGPGSNNGRIPYSQQEMADALGVSKQTAMRAFRALEDHGFIVKTKGGAFAWKIRHASEWRLTEYACDVTGALASKDFTRWKKTKPGSTREPDGVSRWNRSGFVVEPGEAEKAPYGSTREPEDASHGSTREPLLSYQGLGGRR